MFVRVLFFGILKDIAGRPEDTLELPDGATIASIFEHYAERHPRLRQADSSIVFARNRQFSDRETPVMPGDEIAFLPPVSGGAAGLYSAASGDPAQGAFFALTREPIDTRSLSRQILRGEDGALVNFEGVVRNNTKGRPTRFLDYECYEPMALRVMINIGEEIAQRHAIGRIAMVHRLGRMDVGETSVAVLVTAPHRKPAFEAALEGINRLKKLVPIWKKEHFADGEVWVEGEWDESVLAR